MSNTRSMFATASVVTLGLLAVASTQGQDLKSGQARLATSALDEVRAQPTSVPATFSGERPRHAPATNQPMVDDYKITILSDTVPGRRTVGEWGFAALIEVTSGGVSKRFLFDTGGNPDTVLVNARALNLNICNITDVILSHNHDDHTTGLDTLRSSCRVTNPDAFKNAYGGGDELFWPRISGGNNVNYMVGEKTRYLALGGNFVLNSQPTPQFLGLAGVWLTGKIARKHDEKTYPGTPNIQDPDGKLSPDVIPEEVALVINTRTGMVVVTGCAHAGITNTIETAQTVLGGAQPPVTIVGGIHFFPLPIGEANTSGSEGTVLWEAHQLRLNGVIGILGAHCTGFERFVFIRDFLGLDDSAAAFSSVGTSLSTAKGFTYTAPFAMNLPLRVKWQGQLQSAACATNPPVPSCEVSVSAWNYYVVDKINPNAPPLIIGDGTRMMTVHQYLAARAGAGL